MATAMDRAASQRSERINLRVAPEVEAVLREAAALRHKTLSAFLLDAAYEQAQATIEEGRRLRVRTETFERLLAGTGQASAQRRLTWCLRTRASP